MSGAMPLLSGWLHQGRPAYTNRFRGFPTRLLVFFRDGGMCALFPLDLLLTLPSFSSSHIALPGGGDGEPL